MIPFVLRSSLLPFGLLHRRLDPLPHWIVSYLHGDLVFQLSRDLRTFTRSRAHFSTLQPRRLLAKIMAGLYTPWLWTLFAPANGSWDCFLALFSCPECCSTCLYGPPALFTFPLFPCFFPCSFPSMNLFCHHGKHHCFAWFACFSSISFEINVSI